MTHASTDTFLVDSDSWIKFHEELYPPHVFPSLYTQLIKFAGAGRIKTLTAVINEIKNQNTGKWVAALNCVQPATPHVTKLMGTIVQAYPKLTRGIATSADPWLLATAEHHSWVLVTEEGMGKPDKPQLPMICEARGIKWTRGIQMLEKLPVKICAKCL